MLKYLFRPPLIFSRGDYDRRVATIKGQCKIVADMRQETAAKSYEETLSIAIKQRDDAQQEHASAVDRELKATELLQRACVLLKEVDPSRTGGKQLRVAREALFADAMLLGLWGELPRKEV